MSSQDKEVRNRKPVMMTTYATLGYPSEVPTSTGGSSGAKGAPRTQPQPQVAPAGETQMAGPSTQVPSSSSFPSPQRKQSPVGSMMQSTSTLFNLAEVGSQKALLELEDKYNDDLYQLDEELEDCNIPEERSRILAKIERVKVRYAKKKNMIEAKLALEKQEIMLTSGEQYLDNQDEEDIAKWKPHEESSFEIKPPNAFQFDNELFEKQDLDNTPLNWKPKEKSAPCAFNLPEPPKSPNTVAADLEIQRILNDNVKEDYTVQNPYVTQRQIISTQQIVPQPNIQPKYQQPMPPIQSKPSLPVMPPQIQSTSFQQRLPNLHQQNYIYPPLQQQFNPSLLYQQYPPHAHQYHQYQHPPPQPPPPDPIEALTVALNRAIGGGPRADKRLPVFDGNPSEWCNFHEAFKRTSKRYDNAENMMRIQESLRGQAKSIVEHLLSNPNNISDIISKLEERFGRPELVIDNLIEKARGSKPVDGKPESLAAFGTMVEAIITNIKSYHMTGYLHDRMLVSELLKKLPSSEQSFWFQWLVDDSTRTPNLENFAKFLTPRVKAAIMQIKPKYEIEKSSRPPRRQGIHAAEEKKRESRALTKSCDFCKIQGHTLIECRKFKQQSLDLKWNFVQTHNLCRLCFESHHTKICKKPVCSIKDCGKPHNATLHRDPKKTGDRKRTPSPTKSQVQAEEIEEASYKVFNANAAPLSAQVAAKMGTLPIIPVIVEGSSGQKKKIYALLDSGADFNIIEEDIALELGLQGKRSTLHFSVFGGNRKEVSTQVQMRIAGAYRNAKTFNLEEVHTVPKLGIGGISINSEELKRQYPYLQKMNVKSVRNATPQILLSYACYELFSAKQALECPTLTGPSAYRSRLGWYIKMSHANNSLTCQLALHQHPDKLMHEEMKAFFSTESFGVTPIPNSSRSKEDQRAVQLLEKFTVRKEKRWETCLLWREDNPMLPDSKTMAINRLRSMEKKMDKNPEFAQLVEEKFEDYVKKGYLKPRASLDVDGQPGAKKWHLPWFFVHHPTKKPRLVFDAAAKAGKYSLNDFLLKGPDLLNPLSSVLMRFRRHSIALTADIREMFHQVALRQEDWPSQTVLYRGKDRTKPPTEYYMTVLFFGSASSPCSAIYTKNKNAEGFQEKYPKAVQAILHDFYMDDFLGGAETDQEAILLREQLTEIHSAGGFELVKWNSSSPIVLQSIPENMRSEGAIGFEEKSDLVTDKTLGLWWCPVTDHFTFKLNFHRVPPEVSSCKKVPTKRQMTSVVMAVFDPLGFLAPLKVKALMLIQDVWRSGVDWDDEIPTSIFNNWKWWLEQLSQVKEIRIPRKLTTLIDITSLTLHTFCDASEEAFCCSTYAVFHNSKKSPPQCAFLAGKSRVAPLKGLTIPKMELQAALMGSRLASSVKKTFENDLPITSNVYWSDSKSVLAQIRSNTLRYKMFEANRIGEILTLTNVTEWKWVPTALNVADDGTRFVSTCDLSSSSRWLTGPQFILQPSEQWPEEPTQKTDISLEILGVKTILTTVKEEAKETTFTRCSSWSKLLRSSAQAVKFADILKFRAAKKEDKPKPYITWEEIERAKKWLIRQAQEETFTEEINDLKSGKDVNSRSRIYRLSPALNENGILVLQGRINQADVEENIKSPPILDPNHRMTQLLIQWAHEGCGHHGQEQVLQKVRKEAWIINARAAVRRQTLNCFKCKEQRIQPCQPSMGQLPVCRLGEIHIPFFHTGVDYFGPYNISFGRKIIKRWGVIFTCLSTRAVHLELADGLDTSSFIDCLVRFMSNRGKPSHIWSDNGTNFVGANREIHEAMEELEKNVPETLALQEIRCHFNPPSAPHMGGSWERLVGSVKRILSHLLKTQNPKESTLRTLFAEITIILNDRPLCYISSDPEDSECLTPKHFLQVKSAPQQSIPGTYTTADIYRKAWRHGQLLADHFWKRWIDEYLPTLVKREKWIHPSKPLQVGDMVLVVNDQVPRSAWKKGIIISTYPAPDGQVRKVDVRVAHVDPTDKRKTATISIYRRPSVKVCPLGINGIVPQVTGRENIAAEVNKPSEEANK